MKVLFLDIDGVLNHPGCFDGQSAKIDPACARALNRIIIEAECKIVLASSWRCYIENGYMTMDGFTVLLWTHGIEARNKILIGHLDGRDWVGGQPQRGRLAREWLRSYGASSYVALDDGDLGYTESGIPLVQTDGARGLTQADADLAILMLS